MDLGSSEEPKSPGKPVHPALLALPNILTLARLPLAALVWVAPQNAAWVISILAAAAITDMLDGFVARWIRRRRWERERHPGSFAAGTGLGSFLDPLCDKIFMVSVIGAVAWAHQPPISLVLAVATREILMVPAMLIFTMAPRPWRSGHDFTAGWVGKLTTVTQFLTIAALFLFEPGFSLLAVACAPLGAVTVAVYARRATTTRSS